MKKALVTLAASLNFLAGCASMNLGQPVASNYFESEDAGKGVVIFSITVEESCNALAAIKTITLDYKQANSMSNYTMIGSQWVNVKNSLIKPHFENPYGHFHFRSLDAGNYVMGHWSIRGGVIPIHLGLDIPFTVKESEVTYLGELNLRAKSCSDHGFFIENESDRDLGFAKDYFLNFPEKDVVVTLLEDGGLK
jgi:hypothetical protein